MEEMERIKSEAIAAHPTDPVAAARAANAALERRALGSHSVQPREIAALVFLGYYSKNVHEQHAGEMADGAKFANIMPTVYEQLVEQPGF